MFKNVFSDEVARELGYQKQYPEWFDDGSHETYGLECWRYGEDDQEFEIIGNIYENPELINPPHT